MAYDEGMEARIDEIMEGWERYEKKRMFGGICYLKSGNMAFGIWRDDLIVRCGSERYKECLRKKNVKEFDVTGRSMSGWVMVAPEGVEEDSELEKWIRIGDAYVSSLPPKRPK
jgi:TfoX/Sxy family transcriptional regulator of competence genes